jgi:putative aminopeptidase FrvX
MNADAFTFFKSLLATPSPSGYERPIQDVVRDYVASFSDTVTTDTHGNVIAAKNPDASMRVMLAGHCDQIGFLVTHVDKEGFIYLQPIGGWDAQVLLGQKLTIWSDDGPIFGVIARKPIHLLTPEQRKQVAEIKDLWLDIGAKDEDDARAKVRIGDPVTLELGYHDMPNELASSPAMDNKAGLWVVIEALRRAATGSLKVGLFAVSTVQEEIGLRGARTSAYGIDPHVGVAVDVTHATDCPTIDKNQNGDIRLGKGPVIYRGPNMNPVVTQRLMDTAEAKEIDFQLAAIGRATPNDANALQVTRAGMATGLVSIPNRYMHSPVEMISLPDMDRAADLLAETVLSLGGEEDFTP